MTIIYDATNQPTLAYLDILSQVPDGGYIYSQGRFLRKTGWRSAKQVDMRHLDHENGSGADLLAFLEALKAEAPQGNNGEPLVTSEWQPGDDALAEQAEEAAYMHSHPGNGWGL
jgi:hypothetical protein